jgi:site-specific DNA-methyltransferase (adenine-specific)
MPIIEGDCIDILKDIDSDSVDSIITDPPYGFSFMGLNWDKALPNIDVWKECLRILKPGAFMCVMCAPRSDLQSRMSICIEDAGFDIGFTPIYWTFASGFPKAHNIGRMIDKRFGLEKGIIGIKQGWDRKDDSVVNRKSLQEKTNPRGWGESPRCPYETAPSHELAKKLDKAYVGFNPKPAIEVIIIAMKPLSEKTFIDQAMKNGHGCTWFDDCKIPAEKTVGWGGKNGFTNANEASKHGGLGSEKPRPRRDRFPANLLVNDNVLDNGIEYKSGDQRKHYKYKASVTKNAYGDFAKRVIDNEIDGDSGSYSRYFDLDAWAIKQQIKDTFPFLIVSKASQSERNEGCENLEHEIVESASRTYDDRCAICGKKFIGDIVQRCECKDKVTQKRIRKGNFHPTVKPLRLISYLITLFSRKGDLIVDPYCGSGTTCIAANDLGRKWIGIEKEPRYVEIAETRLKAKRIPKNKDDDLEQMDLFGAVEK